MAQEQYLLTITIGPVQDFIASARRSRDLWYGSWLLSELSRAAAVKISAGRPERLIFPSIDDIADFNSSVVNKLTAVIQTDNVSEFVKQVRRAVGLRLKELRVEAFSKIQNSDHFDLGRAVEQVDDLVEFYCACVPLPAMDSYSVARRRTETLLIARKNTRDFTRARWAEEGVPKSSLDGLRETVMKESSSELSDKERRRLFGLRRGELLCGVGLLKRLGNRQGEEGFFSTSHLAALPLLANLDDSHVAAVEKYFDLLKEIDPAAWSRVSGNGSSKIHKRVSRVFQYRGIPCDGQLLFEERLGDYFEKKNADDKDRKAKLCRARSALRKFIEEALGGQRPHPYYALLLADGDGMGDAINQRDEKGHRSLSSQLSSFAKSVRKIVETDNHGSLIYAGGDDVLALLPTDLSIRCAKHLADTFKTAVEGGPTLSAGIAICHHLDPLSDALTLARQAEKEAKQVPSKNALCIKLDKRGGETTTVADHWRKLDSRLGVLAQLFLADMLPDGVAYEFQKLAIQLRYVPDAIPGEVARVLERKRAGHGKQELNQKVREKLALFLKDIAAAKPNMGPLKQLAEELIVARALAAARKLAPLGDEWPRQCPITELNRLLDSSEGGNDATLAY